MKHIPLIAALLIAPFAGAVRAEKDLSQDQIAAYVAVVKADLARDGGAIAEARKRYQEALDLYVAIAKNDPNWHPDIVQFRIAYCRSQLEALRGRAEGERPPEGASGPQGAPNTATAEALERLNLLDAEIADLRAQLDAVLKERDALVAERDACQEARSALESEKAELTVKLDAAARELDAARAAALQRLQSAAPPR